MVPTPLTCFTRLCLCLLFSLHLLTLFPETGTWNPAKLPLKVAFVHHLLLSRGRWQNFPNQEGQMRSETQSLSEPGVPCPHYLLKKPTWALSILWFYFMVSKYQPHLGFHFCQPSFTSKLPDTEISFCYWVKMQVFCRWNQHPRLLSSELMRREIIFSGSDPDLLMKLSEERPGPPSKIRETLTASKKQTVNVEP